MANFAKAQLLKYGWTEGKGLGKNENGIKDPVKPNLKFDTAGIGHKETDVNWWESAFNEAAKNISVKSDTNSVSINVQKKNEEVDKKSPEVKKPSSSLYGNFLKTSTLCDGRMIGGNMSNEEPDRPNNYNISILSDEELLRVCGGRTAHKGARHGLNLSGKLERIARQEQELLESTSLHTWNKSRNARRKEAKEINNLSKVLSKSCSLTETESLKLPECKKQRKDIDLIVINDNDDVDDDDNNANQEEKGKHKRSCCKKKKKSRNGTIDPDLMDRFVQFSKIMHHQFANPSENGEECTSSGESNKKKKKKCKRKRHRENGCDDNENESNRDALLNFKVKKSKKCCNKSDNVDLVEQLNRVSISEDSCYKNKSDSSVKEEEVSHCRKKKKKKRRHSISKDVEMTEAHKLNNRICKKKKSRLRQKEKTAKIERLFLKMGQERMTSDSKISRENKLEIVARGLMTVSLAVNPASGANTFANTEKKKTILTNETNV